MSDQTSGHAERLAKGRRIVQELLGLHGPNPDELVHLAQQVLGVERTALCLAHVRAGPLSRREYLLAELAALVVGTKALGLGWWTRPHHRSDKPGEWQDGPPPDEVLASVTGEHRNWIAPLTQLAYWVEDDVADAEWGPPVGYVDANDPDTSDRIEVPPSARPGDRLVATFDPGERVDVTVVARANGSLGTEIDWSTCRYSTPDETWWAWAVISEHRPHRLPGEEPGSPNDPYAAPVDQGAAETLRSWALRHGVGMEEVGGKWVSAGDVVSAIARVGWERRPSGHWLDWARAAEALADRDPADFAEHLRWLARAAEGSAK